MIAPRRCAAVFGTALLVILASCSTPEPTGGSTASNGATGSNRLTIAIADDEPGVALAAGTGYVGFDIDTAVYVAGKLGVPTANITWKVIPDGDREKVLEDGSVDLVVHTYSITAEREKVVSFAGPYFVAHQDLLIRLNDSEITSPETLNGKTLCAAKNTTSAQYVLDHYKGSIKLVTTNTWSECVDNLVNGSVDAVSTDDLILAGFAAQPQYKGILKVIGKGFTDEKYGIGIKKGNTELVSKVNEALKSYISDGSWKRSLDANVAPSGYKIPAPPSVG